MIGSLSDAGVRTPLLHVRFDQRVIAAALFWAFAYAVLTVHATLDFTSAGRLFSEGRLVATAAGGALLLGILLMWDRLATLRLLLRIKLLALAIGGACAVMYGVRLLAAALFGDYGTTEMADGGRWVIAWAGYFIAAVSTTVAWQNTREVHRLRARANAEPDAAPDYECADEFYNLLHQPPR